MAFNQVSLWFYSSRWQQRLTAHPTALTDADTPVQIASAVAVADSAAAPVLAEAVVNWLAEQGFTPVAWGRGRVFARGRVRTTGGTMQDIIVHFNEEAGEVTDLYCRFTLPRLGAPALAVWAAFAVIVCERFSLRLAQDGTRPCGEAEFVAAVRGNRNFREFAAAFAWPDAEIDAAPDRDST